MNSNARIRCRRCNSPLDNPSRERTWENACVECQQPVWLWAGDVVECTVFGVTAFGILVELAPAIEGMIHVTELSLDARDPSQIVRLGQQITARVLAIDPWERRIGLSVKRVQV